MLPYQFICGLGVVFDLLTYCVGHIFWAKLCHSSDKGGFWPVMNAYSLLQEKGFLVLRIDREAIVFDVVRLMDNFQAGP